MNMELEESEPCMAYMSALNEHISKSVQKNDQQKKWSRVLGRKKPTVSSKKRGNAMQGAPVARPSIKYSIS
jgi:hypothetical protein